jgi:hypothetical protein
MRFYGVRNPAGPDSQEKRHGEPFVNHENGWLFITAWSDVPPWG